MTFTNLICSYIAQEQLVTAELIAKQSVMMLVYEPPSTPEGDLARLGMQQLRKIRGLIEGQHKLQRREDAKQYRGKTTQ